MDGLETLADILAWRPMTPWEGPPLPLKFKLYWPWASFECPVCHERVEKSQGNAANHFYEHLLAGAITRTEYERYMAEYAPCWTP